MKSKHFLLGMVVGLLFVAHGQCQRAFRVGGELDSVADTDPNDGFDFDAQYSGDWSLKVAIPGDAPKLVDNQQVDGGSRTTYSGVNLTDLSFADGTVDIVDSVIPGEFVYWDRQDFSQHVLEMNFAIGQSILRMTFTADQQNSDGAFGLLFTPATPDPNFGELELLQIIDKSDAESLFTNPMVTIDANAAQFGGSGTCVGRVNLQAREVLLGDVNLDDRVSLLDVAPFVFLITEGIYQPEGDINM